MSLQTRLTSFAQAVGADIKSINSKISTATKPFDPWHIVGATGEPAFAAGAGNQPGYTVRYRKDPFGKVSLSGVAAVAAGSGDQIIFTLPAGYRPVGTDRNFTCPAGGGGSTQVWVGTDGSVHAPKGVTYVYLDTIEIDSESVSELSVLIAGVSQATIPIDTWHTVGTAGEPAITAPFALSTTDFRLAFKKDPFGAVRFKGWVTTTGPVAFPGLIFTLPVGYRPPTTRYYDVQVWDADGTKDMAIVTVYNNGLVRIEQALYAGISNTSGTQYVFDAVEFDTETVSQMPTGPAGAPGAKGDPGGTMGAAGITLYSGTAIGSGTVLPLLGSVVMTEDPLYFFTRNADNSMSVKEAGWYAVDATANSNANGPLSMAYGLGLYKNGIDVALPISEGGYYTRAHVSATVYLTPTDKLDLRPFYQGTALTTWTLSHLSVARLGGPQGPKGDPGGIDSYITLNWNTALTPGFYRSTNDLTGPKTINGPGDTLNPPPQAGIVVVHQNGSLVQRVWDLSMQIGYTRHYTGGGAWTAWVSDVVKPPVVAELMLGGADPQDGDERYIQSPLMKAQGVRWRQSYNKTSALTHKWEFAGGSDYRSRVVGGGYTCVTANTWELVSAAVFPRFTIPFTGMYRVVFGCRFHQTITGAVEAYAGIGLATSNQPAEQLRFNAGQQTQGTSIVHMVNEFETLFNEGQILGLFHNTQSNAASVNYAAQYMLIRPLRTG